MGVVYFVLTTRYKKLFCIRILGSIDNLLLIDGVFVVQFDAARPFFVYESPFVIVDSGRLGFILNKLRGKKKINVCFIP